MKNIKKNIMQKIDQGEVKIISKYWFYLINFLLLGASALCVFVAGLAINLLILYIKNQWQSSCMYMQNIVTGMWASFPLMQLFLAILALGLALFLIRKFKFVYRERTVVVFILLMFVFLMAGLFWGRLAFGQNNLPHWRKMMGGQCMRQEKNECNKCGSCSVL